MHLLSASAMFISITRKRKDRLKEAWTPLCLMVIPWNTKILSMERWQLSRMECCIQGALVCLCFQTLFILTRWPFTVTSVPRRSGPYPDPSSQLRFLRQCKDINYYMDGLHAPELDDWWPKSYAVPEQNYIWRIPEGAHSLRFTIISTTYDTSS